jgi:hypothetical protein
MAQAQSSHAHTPLTGDEVVVHVPRGKRGDVRIVEIDAAPGSPEITIQVSRQRKTQGAQGIHVLVK